MEEEKDKTIIKKTTIENSELNNPYAKNKNSTTVVEKSKTEQNYSGSLKSRKIIYYIFGIFEALLICRFIFKLLGANSLNVFVKIIYVITNVLIWPFSNIFRSTVTTGIETASFFEPGTLITMVIYILIAWGITELIKILKTSNKNK